MTKPKYKKNITNEEQINATATLLKKFFNEFKTLYEFYLGEAIPKNEISDYYIKVAALKELEIQVSIFYYMTNTMVSKLYELEQILSLSTLDLINTMIQIDVKKMIELSKEKKYNDMTEIFID